MLLFAGCYGKIVMMLYGSRRVLILRNLLIRRFQFLTNRDLFEDKKFDHCLAFINPEDGVEQWHKPEHNNVKINIDAALFEEPNRYSYAFVIRDHCGSLVEAGSKCRYRRVSPEFAEAVTTREALSWLKNKNLANVVLESDCL